MDTEDGRLILMVHSNGATSHMKAIEDALRGRLKGCRVSIIPEVSGATSV